MLRHAWMGKVEFLSWEHHHSLLLCVPLHADVGCRWEPTVPEGLKGNIIFEEIKEGTGALEAPQIFPENSKQQKVMYDCLHQPKSQFKMRSKCSTGESGQEAVCLQSLSVSAARTQLVISTFFPLDQRFSFKAWASKQFYQFKAQLFILASLP